jgi:serine O-acetyltransferase
MTSISEKSNTPASEQIPHDYSKLSLGDFIQGDIRSWAKIWLDWDDNMGKIPVFKKLKLVFNYAGLRATVLFRLSAALHKKGIPLLPGILSQMNIALHGFDVPAGVEIGPGFYVPHPVGIVIMARQLGSNVTLISNITIGMRNTVEFPLIGDNVFVGAGARILGRVTIGDGASIGANAVVVKDVPLGAVAVGVPAQIKLRDV